MLRLAYPKKLLQYSAKIFISAYSIIMLAGCMETIGQLDLPAAQIVPQQTRRSAVRDMLGDALISSNYWKVDVFRQDTVQTAFGVFFLLPMMNRNDVSRYTIITYNVNGVVESTATGLYRHSSIHRPINSENLNLYLRAGDFFFGIDLTDQHETLAVNPGRRDSYLQLARTSSGCIAVIGSDGTITLDTVALDGQSPLQLPFRWLNTEFDTENQNTAEIDNSKKITRLPEYNALVAFTLDQGEHTLRVSNSGYRGEKLITFACKQGNVSYVVVKGEIDWNAKIMKWDINITESMPETFVGRSLLISRDHQWLVEKEPISIK